MIVRSIDSHKKDVSQKCDSGTNEKVEDIIVFKFNYFRHKVFY